MLNNILVKFSAVEELKAVKQIRNELSRNSVINAGEKIF